MTDNKAKTQLSKAPRKKGGRKKVVPTRQKVPLNRGIYVSISRVKKYIDNLGLNAVAESAITELREGESHYDETKLADGTIKKIFVKSKDTDSMSAETKSTIARASTNEFNIRAKKHKTAERYKSKRDASYASTTFYEEKERDREVKLVEKKARDDADRERRYAERKEKGLEEKKVIRRDKKQSEHQLVIDMIKRTRIHFTKGTALYTTSVVDAMMQELLKAGMSKTIQDDKKIMKVSHLLYPGFESLKYACLYQNLDIIRHTVKSEALKQQAELKKIEDKKQFIKELKAQAKDDGVDYKTLLPEKKRGKKQPVAEDDHDEHDEDSKDFRHYVKQMCSNIINHEVEASRKTPFVDIKVSKEVRVFVSNLIVEFLKRLSVFLQGQITTMRVKTISDKIVKHVVESIFQISNVQFSQFDTLIASKINKYSAFLVQVNKEKKEKARLESELKEQAAQVEQAAKLETTKLEDQVEEPKAHSSTTTDDDEEEDEDDEEPEEKPVAKSKARSSRHQ